jgi:hypothetical protein
MAGTPLLEHSRGLSKSVGSMGAIGVGGGVGGERGSKQRVPKFLHMFAKEFPIARHFYPTCFGKCYPPCVYVGAPNKRNSILQNRTFYFWKLP